MSFRGTFVLAILAAIGAIVFFLSGDPGTGDFVEEQQAEATSNDLLPEAPELDRVEQVQFSRDGETLTFVRDVPPAATDDQEPATPGDWRQVEPIEIAAEQWVVSQLPRTLLELTSKRSFAPGSGEATLAEAGLDPPQLTCQITADGRTYAFAIGKGVPVSNDAYLMVTDQDGSQRVHVVSHDFKPDLDRKAEAFRSKGVFPRERGDTLQVAIEAGKRSVTLANAGNGWAIVAPVQTYADDTRAGDLVNKIWQLRLADFVSDTPGDLERYGLTAPEMVITINTMADENGQPGRYSLLVGAFADLEKTRRFVKLADADWVASVEQTNLDALAPGVNALRDNRIVRFGNERLQTLELQRPDEPSVTLTRVRNEWTGTGELAQIELSAANNVERTLIDLRAVDYVDNPADPAEYGFDAPRGLIRASVEGGEPIEVRIGNRTPSERNTYVQVGGQSSVLVVATSKVEQLLVDPATLRSRKIFALRTDDIVSVRSTVNGRTRVVDRDGGSWRMSQPENAPIDADSFRDLLNDIALLRASAVVAAEDLARFGLRRPVAEIAIEVAQEADTPGVKTLRLSEVAGQAYCVVDDLPYIFQLDPTVYQTLTSELIDRQLLDWSADAVTTITITDATASLKFARTEEGWSFPVDPYVKLNNVALNTLVERMLAMRVKRYLGYSDAETSDAGFDTPQAGLILQAGDEVITLQFGPEIPGEGGRFGLWAEQARAFQATAEAFEVFNTNLEDYVAKEGGTP